MYGAGLPLVSGATGLKKRHDAAGNGLCGGAGMSAHNQSSGSADPATEFRAAIIDAGLAAPDWIEPDGRLHRFPSNGKRGDDSGWYVLHGDGLPAGSFGCWRSGLSETWCAKAEKHQTAAERSEHRARIHAMRLAREAEHAKRQADAKQTAEQIWRDATPAKASHPYLTAKGIQPHGLREHEGALIVPMRDGSELHSLQRIFPDGEKRFLPGGRVTGCYFSIGHPGDVLHICEGYATGASIYEATGGAVAVAFNAGNLQHVARSLREKYPDARLVLCADDDSAKPDNTGLEKATEAAQAVGGSLAVPDFGPDRPDGATDFNDLLRHAGPDAVRRCIDAATFAEFATFAVADWPEPKSLTPTGTAEPFPLEALPALLAAAVAEVQGFTKAPVALVAGSALSVASLAVQALADVQRADGLSGPSGLYLLTVADSGERKTSTDNLFSDPIRAWERLQAENAKPAIADYRGALKAWEAVNAGLEAKAKQAARDSKPTGPAIAAIRDHESCKPEAPRFPVLLRADATPEATAWNLAHEWPSAGVIASEAGLIFGSHAMGKDSIMRNLSQLNILWDGGTLPISRRTSESFTVRGARLTVALQVQQATIREFVSQSAGLARGSGFLARFLITWPESTQGFRPFTEPPRGWPALDTYRRRVLDLLNTPPPVDSEYSLIPPALHLSPQAKALWIRFHDAVEAELRPGGELDDARDVASKAADNCARLACVFHVLEHGPSGQIDRDSIERAGELVRWYLGEARRFLDTLAISPDTANALDLLAWLIRTARKNGSAAISTGDILRLGPNPTRKKPARDAALETLADCGWLRLAQDGKQKLVEINPKAIKP